MVRPIFALLALVLLPAAPLPADDESLTRQASSWVERNPGRLVHGLNQAGLFPSIASFADGTGAAPGLAYFRQDFAGTPLDFYAAGARSFQGDTLLELRLGRIPHVPGHAPTRRQTLEALSPSMVDGSNARPFFAYAEIRHRALLGDRLYDPQGGGVVPFSYKDESYDLVVGYRVASRVVASLRAGRLETDTTLDAAPGSALSVFNGPVGATGTLGFWTTTASLSYDGRDHPRDPRRGSFVEGSVARYAQAGSGPSSFDRVSLDARQYVPLGSERHVLAFHGLASLDSAQSGSYVPFFLEKSLGGSRTLRGFDSFRFRGPRLATVSVEYRCEVKGPLELAAFYDAGKVWGGPVDSGTRGVATSYGMGVRIKSKDDVLIRMDLARGAEGARAHLSFGYSF